MATIFIRLSPSSALTAEQMSSTSTILPLTMTMLASTSLEADITFMFPYNPIQVEYGSLSDEITQIERPATTPIVSFKSHRLMTIDFTALLVHPGDGIVKDVDKEIQTLRGFANSSHRVVELINFDSLTNVPFKFRNSFEETTAGRRDKGIFFTITDFSISSVRRNRENKITQAQVRLSLIENRNPRINVTSIPPFKHIVQNPKCLGLLPSNPKYKKLGCDKKVNTALTAVPPLLSRAVRLAGYPLEPERYVFAGGCWYNAKGGVKIATSKSLDCDPEK